ncbi:hypothetical protein [Tenacibaculum caenipelagi]|uniref:Uncharacterized protein n=1 Tax=Tenacibaculum caenipelagi TaxID=1325435 RepID=A0A4V6PW73_9FLAO|nr:hypothetical protein [Tenacibaculum caenipelagi]TDQ22755.1 hypothetical protein DFQ07_2773 [Tenacibaculum caenipelagi]
MKTENVTNSIVTAIALTGGAMASRVIADGASTVIKNPKLKHGAIAAVAVVGAAFLDRKTAAGSFAQDVAIGVSATQLGYLAKELIGETKGIIKTALGNPINKANYSFLASPSYDFIPAQSSRYSEYEEQPGEIVFR